MSISWARKLGKETDDIHVMVYELLKLMWDNRAENPGMIPKRKDQISKD